MDKMPSPPPGFVLDGPSAPSAPSASVPPPPSGFVLDQSGPTFSVQDMPPLGGSLGFSDDFNKAAHLSTPESLKQSFMPTVADMFGNYQDVANQVAKTVPGAKMVKDKDGYEVLELPSGDRFAMNKPGIQGHELAAAIGKLSAFLPAGKITSLAGRLLPRMAVGGMTAAATDAAMQKVAGRDEIDPAQSLLTGVFGLGGEAIAPVIGAGMRKVMDVVRPRDLIAQGQAIAQKIGLEVSDAIASKIGARADEIAAGADPKAVAAEAVLGTQLTRGQKTGDMAQLAREERLAADPNSGGGAILRAAMEAQRKGLDSARQSVVDQIGGGAAPESAAAAAERVASGVRSQYATLKGEADSAYQALRQSTASISGDAIQQLPQRARAAVQDFDLGSETMPATRRALEVLDQEFGAAAGEVGIKKYSDVLTRLTNLAGSAANRADKAAAGRVKAAASQWLDEAVDSAVVNGDAAAIDVLKKARGLRAELGARFESRGAGDRAGKLVQTMVAGKASPDELAQTMFGASQISPAATANFATKIKAALGDDVGAWDAFRSAVVLKATAKNTGEPLSPIAMVSNIKRFLNERPALADAVLSQADKQALGNLSNAAAAISPKGDFARSSGTAERFMRLASTTASNLPFVGKVLGAMIDLNGGFGAMRPPSLPPPQFPMEAAAAYGSNE